MPMAKKKMNTVVRLAMGTAMLTVISGCESRFARDFNALISPKTADVAAPANNAVAPAESTVVAPEYVVPGAPTYTESSQAANVQSFEAVYGPPVTSGALATSETYTVPSYDDGSVYTQTIAAPVTTTVSTPSYTEQTALAIGTMTYSDASEVTQALGYGDDLSASYTVATEPVISTSSDIGDVYAVETTTTESYSLETLPTVETGFYSVEPAPMPEAESTSPVPSYTAGLPLTDTTTIYSEMPTVETLSTISPVSEAIDPMPMPLDSGVTIIANDEAVATYSGTATLDVQDFSGNDIGDQSSVMPLNAFGAGTMQPIEDDTYAPPAASTIRTADLSAPEISVSPLPQQKRYAPTNAIDYSPALAPLPRPRPSTAGREYATLNAPLPQPRPRYKKPMAVATTSGDYVSIGSLPDDRSYAASPPVLEYGATLTLDAGDGNSFPTDTPFVADTVQEATLRAVAPRVPPVEEPVRYDASASELSGTSWRLAEIAASPVTVNTELHFDGASGFAGGQGPCNSYGGEFVNTGKGRFSMENIFSTEIGCSDIEVERQYLSALETARRYEIEPGFSGLTLLDDSGRKIAHFKAF